jgi:hypothetical protein
MRLKARGSNARASFDRFVDMIFLTQYRVCDIKIGAGNFRLTNDISRVST